MTASRDEELQPATLGEVISAAAERIHYAEGRRTNFTVVAGALLAGGVAILTFVPEKMLSNMLTYFALGASIGAICLGLLILIVFARQTNRYPWTSATNTWKWFYRDALPDQKKFDWTWREILSPRKEKQRLQTEFNRQLPEFEQRTEKLKDVGVSLAQDVQQLYVLHINDKFKNAHLSQLRTLLSRGLTVVAIVALAFGYCGWRIDQNRTMLHHTKVRHGVVEINTSWRFVSPNSRSGVVLAKVTITNRGTKCVRIPGWTFLDEHGMPVPSIVSSPTREVKEVAQGTTVQYSVLVKPAEPVYVEGVVPTLR